MVGGQRGFGSCNDEIQILSSSFLRESLKSSFARGSGRMCQELVIKNTYRNVYLTVF
jgi:hypothetical protein